MIRHCLNCSTALHTGPYCGNCGQRNVHARLEWFELLQDIRTQLLEWHLPWLFTLREMLLRPGVACGEYLAGHRVRYVNPLKYFFYLTSLGLLLDQVLPLRYQLLSTFALPVVAGLGDLNRISTFFAGNPLVLAALLAPLISVFFRVAYRRTQYNKSELTCCILYTLGNAFLLYFLLNLVLELALDHVLQVEPFTPSYARFFAVKLVVALFVVGCHTVYTATSLFAEPWYKSALKTLGISTAYGMLLIATFGFVVVMPAQAVSRQPSFAPDDDFTPKLSLLERERRLLANLDAPGGEGRYGLFLLDVGRTRDGLYHLLRAAEASESTPNMPYYLAGAYLQGGNMPFARTQIDQMPAQRAQTQRQFRILMAMEAGNRDLAVELARGEDTFAADLALAQLWRDDRLDEAREELHRLVGSGEINRADLLGLAWANLFQDYRVAGMLQQGNLISHLGIYWMPMFAEYRRSEGFRDYVRRTGLLDYWHASGTWADKCRPAGEDDFECF